MKITNKKILALILLAATLTACDSLKGNEKPADTKVEENADQKDSTDAEKAEDADKKEDAEGADKDVDLENADGEDADSADTKEDGEAVTSEGSTPREKLEDAIFKSRVQARAAEILLETNPESIADIRGDLEALVEKSNKLIEEAQRRLDEMDK